MDYLIYNLADAHLQPLANAEHLSDEERATAQKRGKRYVLTRSLLRRELARRLGGSPAGIRIHLSEQGKPECEGIHFNISHSGDCFAMAFDADPIGIDVERIRPRTRMEALAARIMCPEQLAAFRERGCPMEEFYTCWCTAEALVKQAAGSIWQAARHPFLCEYGRIRLLSQEEPPALNIRTFCPMPGYMGAVASIHPPFSERLATPESHRHSQQIGS